MRYLEPPHIILRQALFLHMLSQGYEQLQVYAALHLQSTRRSCLREMLSRGCWSCATWSPCMHRPLACFMQHRLSWQQNYCAARSRGRRMADAP